MPQANQTQSNHKSILLTGVSGVGKSTIAYHAPQPIAALLLDKSSIDIPPGVDADGIFYKQYPPAQIDLSKDDHGRARNIADGIITDIQLLRDHFMAKKPLKMKMFDGTFEDWPTPKTVILEGGDFLAQHVLNLICARHNKKNPDEWDNVFTPWGLRLVELHAIYDQLTYLPCNVIVTTGPEEETKMVTSPNGKKSSEKTGRIMPDLGGAMCMEGPRKFASSLYIDASSGKHLARTRSNAKYIGFKLSGHFGEQEQIDITLDRKQTVMIDDRSYTVNLWQKLFE